MSRSSSRQSNPLVSILVPIYNAEDFLEECLGSLINQTYDNYEIICLNDGSTDNSLKIIKNFAKQSPRIKLIDGKNHGYGGIMNIGLEYVKGNYFTIVESDDFLEKTALSEFVKIATTHNADLVRANYFHHQKNRDILQKLNFTTKAINPLKDQSVFLQPPAIWSMLYKTELIKNNEIKFLETPGASFQDTSFVFKTLSCSEKVIQIPKAFLHYRVDNESSVTNPKKVFYVCNEYYEIENFLRQRKILKKLEATFTLAKFRTYLWNLDHLKKSDAKNFIKTIKVDFSDSPNTKKFTKKDLLKLRLIKFFPNIFYIVYNINKLRSKNEN